MKIYIDSDFKCYSRPAEDRTEIEIDFLDGKCSTFVEGYMYVPFGQTWIREDGEVFKGEALFPFVDIQILESAQAQYEKDLAELQDMQAALELLGVIPNE